MSRFDYVKYDGLAIEDQERAKQLCTSLDLFIWSLGSERAKALAHTKLEECYMWIGKALRDAQLDREAKT